MVSEALLSAGWASTSELETVASMVVTPCTVSMPNRTVELVPGGQEVEEAVDGRQAGAPRSSVVGAGYR